MLKLPAGVLAKRPEFRLERVPVPGDAEQLLRQTDDPGGLPRLVHGVQPFVFGVPLTEPLDPVGHRHRQFRVLEYLQRKFGRPLA
jgi:hypothetical protein